MFNRGVLEEHAQSDSCRLTIVRVSVCVCASKGWQIPSVSWIQDQSITLITHTVNNNEKLICSAHTHAYALASSGSVHAASIWECYVTKSSSLHNSFILFHPSLQSLPSLSRWSILHMFDKSMTEIIQSRFTGELNTLNATRTGNSWIRHTDNANTHTQTAAPNHWEEQHYRPVPKNSELPTEAVGP